MNLGLVYTFSAIFLLIIFGLIIYLIREKLKDRDDPADDLIIENYMPEYANGHTDGVVDSIVMVGDRVKIKFFPRDIKYSRFANEKLTTIKPLTVVYRKDRLVYIPEGSFSAHRNKLKAFPNELEDLPEGVKNSAYGSGIMNFITNRNETKDSVDLLKKRQVNLKRVLDKSEGLDIVDDYFTLNKEMITSVQGLINQKPEEKK